jgi:hypothetical protein
MKNIILCSDGTGNTAVKGRGTNVFKLFEAVDLTEHRTNPSLDAQLAFYDDGVGTQGNALVKMLGGAAGYGLAQNVKKLYRELARVYDPGDRIFLFGFSRGAFTVRTLAGMIGRCGVLNAALIPTAGQLVEGVDAAYAGYRAGYGSVLTKAVGGLLGRPSRDDAIARFKDKYRPYTDVEIAFLGVWDTVDAVGMPFALAEMVNRYLVQFKFPTSTLGSHVQHACHALSLDDDRRAFEPVLWTVPEDDHRIEQVWFAGVHSNVGGGYPKQGMSLVALDWMLCHAALHGLRLQTLDHDIARGHASVDDTLYDPRAGLGLFYRWAPRDVRKYCTDSGVPARIHLTVGERIAHGTADYAPGNVPGGVTVAVTPGYPPGPESERKTRILQHRAAAIEQVMRKALPDGRYLLDDVRFELRLGDDSYWLFMASWLAVGICVVSAFAGLPGLSWAFGFGAIAGFFGAWRLAGRVDAAMSDKFSEFWHRNRPELRQGLKDAHAAARAMQEPTPEPPPAATGPVPHLPLDGDASSGVVRPPAGNGDAPPPRP